MGLFAGLSPEPVWRHFEALCAIPHPSRREEALRRHLIAWASARGLSPHEDAVGNLLIRKPATAGRHDRPGVILQAHLDMVAEAAAGTVHDFARDPIRPVVAEGWVSAPTTTLGADNGIGVALALAVLEDDALLHPPLEVLLTVDEECGMGGARGLAPGWLQGRILLNLDTEAWGEFFIGCAGGCDVEVSRVFALEPSPADGTAWRISVGGLVGGHSGCDIAQNRGNANKILAHTLRALVQRTEGRLAALSGGSARNAIPRDAWADVVLPADAGGWLPAFLAEQGARQRADLTPADARLTLSATLAPACPVLSAEDQGAVLDALCAAPCGVRRMSEVFSGVVETSNNLGVVRLEEGRFAANLMVRSLVDDQTRRLADDITALFEEGGFSVRQEGFYPGWEPKGSSPVLALCQEVYAREFGVPSGIQVIHAGLECGIIGAKYPGVDMLSFGPTIVGPHAPGEKVEIESVDQAWRLLKAVLAAV